MAITLRHEIHIEAAQSDVWAAFCRLDDWPRWFPALTAVDRKLAGAFVVDEAFTLRLSFRGHAAAVAVRVMSYDPPRRVRWVGKNLGVTGDHSFFTEVLGPTQTRFVSEEHFTGFPVRFIPRRIFGELEDATRAGLDRFAALVRSEP